MLGKLLRLFGYVFSGGLCLGMIGLGLVAWLSGSSNFALGMIPWWTGQTLAKWLVTGGVFGLVATILAARGKVRILMLAWTAVVLGMMVYGFYLSTYTYEDWAQFQTSLELTGAAVLAFLGAITGMFVKRPDQRYS